MLALAHLRIDALLAVLTAAACVMASLRALRALAKRSVDARDRRAIQAATAAHERAEGSSMRPS